MANEPFVIWKSVNALKKTKETMNVGVIKVCEY